MALNNNSEECSDKLRAKIEEWLKWDQVNSELDLIFEVTIEHLCELRKLEIE